MSTPRGAVRAGPSDDRLHFVWPIGKPYPYGINLGPFGTPFLSLPPWKGPAAPAVEPGPDGHFDHIDVGTPEFEAAHLFAVTHFVMDVWEGYLGHPIRWHFSRDFERLELSILPDWDNGQIGYGYLEVGSARRKDGEILPFSLNFDVIAHEVGHGIIYAEVGVPALDAESGEYFGFHEAAADWVAMIAALHFPSVVERLLQSCRGNLYTYNEFNRFSEFSDNEQIRDASNFLKLSDFQNGWRDEHKLSEPLSGALFDIFVDTFHEALVEVGAIDRSLEDLADIMLNRPEFEPELQAEFDEAYARDPEAFAFALTETRDLMGEMLVVAWKGLSPDNLSYAKFADAMLAADEVLTGGRLNEILLTNFWWREIGIVRAGPRIGPATRFTHTYSSRSATPADRPIVRNMGFREKRLVARATGG